MRLNDFTDGGVPGDGDYVAGYTPPGGTSGNDRRWNFQNIFRANVAQKADANVAINGAMDVSQELGTTGATLTNNTAQYILDCFEAMYNHAAGTAVVTSAQLAAASFPSVLNGFNFGHQLKATTAITSPASGDFAKFRSKIEGYRIAHWGWGASGAAGIVVAFNLYSTASGTAFVKLSNSDQSRCYYHEIIVSAGWNFYAFKVAGDTSGTWQTTTSIGLTFELFVSGKETTPASSLDAWGTVNKVQTANSSNLLGTNNDQAILTGLFIMAGSSLPVVTDLPILMRSFDIELTRCKRYLEFAGAEANGQCTASTTASFIGKAMAKRIAPTITTTSTTPSGLEFSVSVRVASGFALSSPRTSVNGGYSSDSSGWSSLTAGHLFGFVADYFKLDARL